MKEKKPNLEVKKSNNRPSLRNILLIVGGVSLSFGIMGLIRPLGTSAPSEMIRGVLNGVEFTLGTLLIIYALIKPKVK